MSTARFQYLESWRLYLERTPSIILFVVLSICTLTLTFAYYRKVKIIPSEHEPPEEPEGERGYPPITPLPNFNWETTEPLVLRPFKPKYHLTMGTLRSIPVTHPVCKLWN
jgi:hypothetical protein